MIQKLKDWLYFPVAYYFAFWARIQLFFWKPRIIVITGSSGKTTLLHFIESQVQDKARYSHRANSSYGIPFDILGLSRKKLTVDEWPYLFLVAPFKAFKKPYKQRLYIVEADCDRPYEGKFLGKLLKPEVTLWTNSARTHSMNFEKLVKRGKFNSVDEAIAYEFGHFIESTSGFCIVNGDSELIQKQLNRTNTKVKLIKEKEELKDYKIFKDRTDFLIRGKRYTLPFLLPKETFYSISMTLELLNHLKIKPDSSFSRLYLPPGRSSIFKGVKDTTLIDSSYNAVPESMRSVLKMYNHYPTDNKWLVLSDMIELGDEEPEEHIKLAGLISKIRLSRIILMGPRTVKHTYPKLKELIDNSLLVEKFLTPSEVLDYLKKNIKGGETILFKGARFLEGVIEHLLKDKNDAKQLCRREKIWQIRRKQWGL